MYCHFTHKIMYQLIAIPVVLGRLLNFIEAIFFLYDMEIKNKHLIQKTENRANTLGWESDQCITQPTAEKLLLVADDN